MSTTPAAHALLSASAASRWSRCPASVKLTAHLPRRETVYSAEGTAAHDLAARVLIKDPTLKAEDFPNEEVFESVMAYVKLVKQYAEGGTLLVEQRVDYSRWLEVPDSFGTSDTVILFEDRIVIIDLKMGRGVKVDAFEPLDDAAQGDAYAVWSEGVWRPAPDACVKGNEQLMLYALGALYEYEMLGEFQSVTMVIHQPRLEHVSEYTVSVDELVAFAEDMAVKAARAMAVYNAPGEPEPHHYEPGDKQCRWCDAMATCKALTALVETESRDLFADMLMAEADAEMIGSAMSKVDMIESYCKAIRAEAERRLLAGQPVPGWKLVEGRRGPRSWSDTEKVETLCKSFRLKKEEMYDFKLKSPTVLEKEMKGNKFPGRWDKLAALIEQTSGKPSVAPASDKRAALQITSSDNMFAALAAPMEDEG